MVNPLTVSDALALRCRQREASFRARQSPCCVLRVESADISLRRTNISRSDCRVVSFDRLRQGHYDRRLAGSLAQCSCLC